MTLSYFLHGDSWALVGDLKSINAAVAIDFDFSSPSKSCVSGVLSGSAAILSSQLCRLSQSPYLFCIRYGQLQASGVGEQLKLSLLLMFGFLA